MLLAHICDSGLGQTFCVNLISIFSQYDSTQNMSQCLSQNRLANMTLPNILLVADSEFIVKPLKLRKFT